MTAWGSSNASRHIVSEGRVFCQRDGSDVDVEKCWRCDRLLAYDTDDGSELIRCEPMPLDRLAALLSMP